MRIAPVMAFTLLLGSTTFVLAQTNHTDHAQMMDHSQAAQTGAPAGPRLTEPGQGAFAALSEVVAVLEADPDVDWSKVDLGALRAHLVDMDRLVTHTVVEETVLPDGISAVATGDPDTLATLRRMVPAHAAELASDDRWNVTASEGDDSVTLTVTSGTAAVADRIKALGFFGLMASQDHHRAHHLMIARGEPAHGH